MDKAIIEGYICLTDKPSKTFYRRKYGFIVETIKTGAFRTAVNRNKNIPLMFNHDKIIANHCDIELQEDGKGLRFKAWIADINSVTKIVNNEIQGCSFGFDDYKDVVTNVDGITYREIIRLNLNHVSICNKPTVHASIINVVNVPARLMFDTYKYKSNSGYTGEDYYRKCKRTVHGWELSPPGYQ